MTSDPRDSGSRVALNTASAWAANGGAMLVGFFLTPFLLAHLGDRIYGLYSLAASIGAWTTFVGIPIGTYASRYATEHLERREFAAFDRTLATSLGLAILAAALLLVPISLFAAHPEKLFTLSSDIIPAARSAILIIGLTSALTIVVRVWESRVFTSRRFYLLNATLLVSRLVGAAVVVAYFWWVGPSLTVWLLTMTTLPLLLSVCFVIPRAGRGMPALVTSVALDRDEIRRALPFVLFLAFGSLGQLLFDSTDALLISSLPELGVSHVATYDIGARWWRLLRPLIEAFLIAVSPALITLATRDDRLALRREVIARTRHSMLVAMIPVVSIASVAGPFITHWVGVGYTHASVPVMWLTLASLLLWAPGMYCYRVALSLSTIRLTMASLVASGVLNLLLSIAFVHYFELGLLGIAVGTLVSVILWSNMFMGILTCRTCSISPLQYFREAYAKPGLTLLILVAVAWGIAHLWIPGSLLQTLFLLALLAVSFCPIVFVLGLTIEERAALRNWVTPRISAISFRIRKAPARRNNLLNLLLLTPRRRSQHRGVSEPQMTPSLAAPLRASRGVTSAGVDAPTPNPPRGPERPSVCFVAPHAYAALCGREDVAHIGGAERQQVTLSEELLRRGYRVSFIVLDHGQPDGEEIRGIRVFKCYRTDRGPRGLRFFHPRLTGLWNAMKRSNADIYYQRGADYETGLVGHWCRRYGRGFIFAVAHDINGRRVTPFISRPERLAFLYGLRRADAIISQTFRQQSMISKTFGLASTVIRSCSAWPVVEETTKVPSHDELADRVLWVGRLSDDKRPEWMIRLATDLPECKFDVVGQCNTKSKYGQSLAAQIDALPNVRWHGYVHHGKIRALYQQAQVLLCTSPAEGFPNVFLEAWSCGKSVITSTDPDDVVATFQLGQVASDYATMRELLANLATRRAAWEAAGLRGRMYVREHHSTAAVVDALESILQSCHDSAHVRQCEAGTFATP